MILLRKIFSIEGEDRGFFNRIGDRIEARKVTQLSNEAKEHLNLRDYESTNLAEMSKLDKNDRFNAEDRDDIRYHNNKRALEKFAVSKAGKNKKKIEKAKLRAEYLANINRGGVTIGRGGNSRIKRVIL